MSAEQKKTTELVVRTGGQANDRLLIVSTDPANTANAKTATIVLNNLLSNTPNLQISVTKLTLNSNLGTPANTTSTNVAAGTWWTDGSYGYIATADNHVKRFGPLSDF